MVSNVVTAFECCIQNVAFVFVSCKLSDSGTLFQKNRIWREGLGVKRFYILEAQAGVGCGQVDVKDKLIRVGTPKWCVWGKIHIRMKPTAVEIMNRMTSSCVIVRWVMVSWTKVFGKKIMVVTSLKKPRRKDSVNVIRNGNVLIVIKAFRQYVYFIIQSP